MSEIGTTPAELREEFVAHADDLRWMIKFFQSRPELQQIAAVHSLAQEVKYLRKALSVYQQSMAHVRSML